MPRILTVDVYEITNETPEEALDALTETFNRSVLADLRLLAEEVFGFKVSIDWGDKVELETNFKNGNYKIHWTFDLLSKRKKDHFTPRAAAKFWQVLKEWLGNYESDNNKIYWNQSGFEMSPSDKNESDALDALLADDTSTAQKKKSNTPKHSAKRTQSTIKRPGRTWLIYGRDYGYEQLLDDDLESISWTIHKDAEIGDWVYFYITAPISAIVGSGRVASRPLASHDAEQFSSVMPYFANIELYNLFENPLTYYQMYDDPFIYDRWSLVHSQMQSSRGPQQVPYSVLKHMDEVYDLRPY